MYPAMTHSRLFHTVALALAISAAGCSEKAANWAPPNLDNPLVQQRADPWVYRAENGAYYFTATVPEFNRIELRRAQDLKGLAQAPARVIWRKHTSGPMSANIWSPELHRIEGRWYIFFAAGERENPLDIRLYGLVNDSEDPLSGEWRETGRIETQYDTFALDATTFEHRGRRYLVWSQKDPEDQRPAALHISLMAGPTTLSGPEVMIAEPEHPWEQRGIPANQGATILKHGDRIFLFYTASATDHRSAIGLLWADAEADLLDPASWHKRPDPVLATNADVNRQGPGHPSLTTTGKPPRTVLLYHSREYTDLHGDQLEDPNRHTRARLVRWDEQGMPVLNTDAPD